MDVVNAENAVLSDDSRAETFPATHVVSSVPALLLRDSDFRIIEFSPLCIPMEEREEVLEVLLDAELSVSSAKTGVSAEKAIVAATAAVASLYIFIRSKE
jgi:hypothetical protein